MVDIVALDNLPQKQSFRKHLQSDPWKYPRKCWMKPINHYYAYIYIEWLLEKYEGRHINLAFSHYCRIVPKNQQSYFYNYLNHVNVRIYCKYKITVRGIIIQTEKN